MAEELLLEPTIAISNCKMCAIRKPYYIYIVTKKSWFNIHFYGMTDMKATEEDKYGVWK